MNKRVCVIGAGISGLSCINQLEAHNIDYICYEKRKQLGGLWNYSDNETSVYKNCKQNHPRKYMHINETHIENTTNDYLTHEEYLDYLKQFDSTKIEYNSTVSNAYFDKDESVWKITVNDKVVSFSDLIICTGHYTKPNIPKEYQCFSGELLHSIHYKIPEKFKNKKVLIIGGGSSAIQIASDLVSFAKEISLSIRSMPYILERYINKQTLFDFYQASQNLSESEIIGLLFKYEAHQTLFNIPAPEQNLLNSSTVPICDEIFSYANENKIKFLGKVLDINGNNVQFDNYESTFDVMILATGYNLDFDFFDFKVGYADNLYHIANKNNPSLYFIGMLQPVGPVPRLLDIQSKVVCKLINEEIDLNQAKNKNIQLNKRVNLREYVTSLIPLLETHYEKKIV